MLSIMPFESWLAFAVASTVLVIIPGPTILSVVAYSISCGRRALVPLTAGVALGDAVAVFASIVGLGALLNTSAELFVLVKWVGGLYLIYLGLRMLLSKSDGPVNAPELVEASQLQPEIPNTKLFLELFVVTALNPKGLVFFVAFLPQFVDVSRPVVPQLALLSVTFVVLGTLNAALYAVFASAAGSALEPTAASTNSNNEGSARRGMIQRRLNQGGGVLLCAAGLWALTVRQPGSG